LRTPGAAGFFETASFFRTAGFFRAPFVAARFFAAGFFAATVRALLATALPVDAFLETGLFRAVFFPGLVAGAVRVADPLRARTAFFDGFERFDGMPLWYSLARR
jgi:hypothetical protein